MLTRGIKTFRYQDVIKSIYTCESVVRAVHAYMDEHRSIPTLDDPPEILSDALLVKLEDGFDNNIKIISRTHQDGTVAISAISPGHNSIYEHGRGDDIVVGDTYWYASSLLLDAAINNGWYWAKWRYASLYCFAIAAFVVLLSISVSLIRLMHKNSQLALPPQSILTAIVCLLLVFAGVTLDYPRWQMRYFVAENSLGHTVSVFAMTVFIYIMLLHIARRHLGAGRQ